PGQGPVVLVAAGDGAGDDAGGAAGVDHEEADARAPGADVGDHAVEAGGVVVGDEVGAGQGVPAAGEEVEVPPGVGGPAAAGAGGHLQDHREPAALLLREGAAGELA